MREVPSIYHIYKSLPVHHVCFREKRGSWFHARDGSVWWDTKSCLQERHGPFILCGARVKYQLCSNSYIAYYTHGTQKIEVWKIIVPFSWVIFRFHVNFPGCTVHTLTKVRRTSEHHGFLTCGFLTCNTNRKGHLLSNTWFESHRS